MDAMDEGEVGGAGRNVAGEVLQKLLKWTSQNKHGSDDKNHSDVEDDDDATKSPLRDKVSVVITAGPDVNAVQAVRVALGVPNGDHTRWRLRRCAVAAARAAARKTVTALDSYGC